MTTITTTDTSALSLPAVADDAATIIGWTDHHAATIIARTPRTVTVREDRATWLNRPGSGEPDALVMTPGGYAGHVEGEQRWHLTSDPDGRVSRWSLRKSGRWVRVGQPDSRYSDILVVGRRCHYRDLGF